MNWIATSKVLPAYGVRVLLYSPGTKNYSRIGYRERTDKDGEHYVSDVSGADIGWEITHWMPLPSDPVERKGAKA